LIDVRFYAIYNKTYTNFTIFATIKDLENVTKGEHNESEYPKKNDINLTDFDHGAWNAA
jgi:hypothetical protein